MRRMRSRECAGLSEKVETHWIGGGGSPGEAGTDETKETTKMDDDFDYERVRSLLKLIERWDAMSDAELAIDLDDESHVAIWRTLPLVDKFMLLDELEL